MALCVPLLCYHLACYGFRFAIMLSSFMLWPLCCHLTCHSIVCAIMSLSTMLLHFMCRFCMSLYFFKYSLACYGIVCAIVLSSCMTWHCVCHCVIISACSLHLCSHFACHGVVCAIRLSSCICFVPLFSHCLHVITFLKSSCMLWHLCVPLYYLLARYGIICAFMLSSRMSWHYGCHYVVVLHIVTFRVSL